jgi:hypothetical protein
VTLRPQDTLYTSTPYSEFQDCPTSCNGDGPVRPHSQPDENGTAWSVDNAESHMALTFAETLRRSKDPLALLSLYASRLLLSPCCKG